MPHPEPTILHPHVWPGWTHQTWSYIIWCVWIFVGFGTLEATARDLTGIAPWFTLSETVKTLIRDHPWFGLLFIYFLLTLAIHLLFPQNKWGL